MDEVQELLIEFGLDEDFDVELYDEYNSENDLLTEEFDQ